MTAPISLALLLLGEVLFAPAPADVIARNEVERMVLTRAESASRDLEQWLARQPDTQSCDRTLIDAGFRRIRPDDVCAHYVYTRRLTATVQRGASVILCGDKAPFVLRTDELPGPWTAPRPGDASGSVPRPQ